MLLKIFLVFFVLFGFDIVFSNRGQAFGSLDNGVKESVFGLWLLFVFGLFERLFFLDDDFGVGDVFARARDFGVDFDDFVKNGELFSVFGIECFFGFVAAGVFVKFGGSVGSEFVLEDVLGADIHNL